MPLSSDNIADLRQSAQQWRRKFHSHLYQAAIAARQRAEGYASHGIINFPDSKEETDEIIQQLVTAICGPSSHARSHTKCSDPPKE